MRKILVTGGAGFIGSSLVDRLAEDKENFVVVVDNLITGTMANIDEGRRDNVRFIKCDVNDYKNISSVFYGHSFDYVFHYAALVGVKRTLENPVSVLKDVEGIKNILELAKNTTVKRVFYSSSSEVYGEPVEYPQNEHTTPLNSRLPYAIVKNIGEAFFKAYQHEYDLDYTIFRFFNTYGTRQSKDFVISKFINLANNNQNITVYGDGLQTRTFCNINDNIDATITAFYNGEFINDVVNMGSSKETSILELANKIIALTNSNSKIIHLPALEEGDMTRRLPDNSKMKKLLNRELMDLKEGLLHLHNHKQQELS